MKKTINSYLWVLACSILVSAIVGMPFPARADETSLVGRTLQDTELYFTQPLHWDAKDWTYFGGTLAVIAASHALDGRVRDHFATGSKALLNGKDPNSTRDALPTAAIFAGTWAYAALLQSHAGYSEGWSMAEAGGLSTVTALALKFAAGRLRPNETTQPNQWGKGGSSFPSLHTTAAFAIGTVLAESGDDSYRWVRRLLGYGVAVGTIYLRLHDNAHWLSDTVAGGALGMSTAIFVLNRREHRDFPGEVGVAPVERGMMLTYAIPLH